jgi:hypothetical protein
VKPLPQFMTVKVTWHVVALRGTMWDRWSNVSVRETEFSQLGHYSVTEIAFLHHLLHFGGVDVTNWDFAFFIVESLWLPYHVMEKREALKHVHIRRTHGILRLSICDLTQGNKVFKSITSEVLIAETTFTMGKVWYDDATINH